MGKNYHIRHWLKHLKKEINFDADGFLMYLMSHAGGKKDEKIAKPIVSEIVKFYQQFEHSATYYDTILNMQNSTTYMQTICEVIPLCVPLQKNSGGSNQL